MAPAPRDRHDRHVSIESPQTPASSPSGSTRIPPRWFIRTAWVVHRAIYNVSGGRMGLRPPTSKVWGMMRLHTVGRRSGEPREAIVAYIEDGTNLVTMAMNGWGDPPPAWWLNLQARPEASVDLPEGRRRVRAREAQGSERERLWNVYRTLGGGDDLDANAARRSRETPIIVLEPAGEAH